MRSAPVALVGLVLATALGSVGCRSQQLAHDQNHIRAAVMSLHEDQIMDNLVRAKKGLPILHVDYTNLTGTITQTGNTNSGGTQTLATSQYFNLPVSSLAISRLFTNLGMLGAYAQQVNQLTVTGQPVTASPEVYNAYLEYIKVPDRLRKSASPPSCDEAILVRCYEEECGCAPPPQPGWWHHGGKRATVYYWIPQEYVEEFRTLCLFTVSVRGQPAAVSPNFDVTVQGVTSVKPIDEDNYELFVQLDKKVPNDEGYLVVTVAGRPFKDSGYFDVLVNTTEGRKRAQPGTILGADQQTDVLRVSVNLATLSKAGDAVLGKLKIEDLIKGLAGQKVGVRLKNFLPSGSPTDRALEDLRHQTELFRLGQQQPGR